MNDTQERQRDEVLWSLATLLHSPPQDASLAVIQTEIEKTGLLGELADRATRLSET